jgi:hypothetical protein
VYWAKIGQPIFAITILPIFYQYRVYWPNMSCHLFGPNSGVGVMALEKQRIFVGEDHCDTLYTMAVLAGIYRLRGQFERAEELLEVVLERQRKIIGDHHPNTIGTMRSLAMTYYSLGKVQDAEELETLLGAFPM